MNEQNSNPESETKEFDENPFDHQNKRPEDVVRLFYLHDVPVIPVVSKRGMLLGVLRKESVIAELSDIERVEKLKIDEFITRLAARMSFDDLLPYGKIKEFIVINIFGEEQGTWSRLQLFSACDTSRGTAPESEIKKQQEDQALEWMIYLILEHIPRALYALNSKGSTIFYNSHFEDIYTEKLKNEVDPKHVEKLLSNPSKNELFAEINDNDLYFYNTELGMFYEKVPLLSGGRKSGFLIFFDNKSSSDNAFTVPGVDLRGKSLQDVLDSVERHMIVEALQKHENNEKAAESLNLSRQALGTKIKKFGIANLKK
ncbi:MAG TPA: helix-turn-helix domain-containing protein [Spirochaetota bacterium]|nr:helix-turn-helix domain-containing protein [Spirochaetota bacterium]